MFKLQYICLIIFYYLPWSIYSENCPQIETMANFEPKRFIGKWYEIEKYPNVWEAGQKCITANYQLNSDGNITVMNSGILKLINYPITIRGIATPNDTNPAKLVVQFNRFAPKGKLWILETDYQNYALTYSCTSLPILPINIENAWIMSRTPTLDPQIAELLKSRLSAVNSPTFMFRSTDQSNCPGQNKTKLSNTSNL